MTRSKTVQLVGSLLAWLCVAVLSTAPVASADPSCTPLNTNISVGSALASAGFFANMRGSADSIKARMDALLAEARSAASSLASKERGCARSCETPRVAVVFTSKPRLVLKEYEEAATCSKLLESTTATPITYNHRRFSSDDEAKAWYNDLTQGDGKDGEDLYQRCPGSCSPSYSSVAYQDAEGIVVSTSIICGPARDKDDNQYQLAAAIRWVCP
jgi:hypothetical protein